MKPKRITEAEYNEILHANTWEKSKGLYWFTSVNSYKENVWVGCDNSTGAMWTESFESKSMCIQWLNDKTIEA